MPTVKIRPPRLHPGQQQVWDDQSRFRVLACGRRWGKTRLGSLLCIHTAVRGGRAWWIAPSYPVSTVGWRLIKRLGAQMPGAVIRRVERTVTLPGGGMVQVRSADNPDSLRGEGLDFLVMDECAFIKEDAWAEALRPALSDRLGKALFISTPSGRNWFWRLYQKGLDNANGCGDWRSWRFPTGANPFIAPREIEAARDLLPAAIFEQEYLAEFLEHEGAVFRNIQACLGAPLDAGADDHRGHRIVMGVDWGKQVDLTAISVGCADCRVEVALDRFNQIDYVFQRARLATLAEEWGPTTILAEQNAIGDPILEMLQREGLPVAGFMTTAASKPPLIESLALALERAEWQWLDIPVATGELEAYERKVSPTTGRSSYGAPAGLHDDTVIARALMHRAATGGGPSWDDVIGLGEIDDFESKWA